MSKKHLLFSAITVLILLATSAILLLLAQGYRLDLKKRELSGSGILVVNSTPDGALIFLNDVPKDATNTSITALSPGTYQLRLEKQGFSTYQRQLQIRKGLVTKVEALLLPLFPELKPLTYTGASSPLLSPDGSKIIYNAHQNSEAGLWLLDLSDRPFSLSSPASLLLSDTEQEKYSEMQIEFSPDSKHLLLKQTQAPHHSFLFDLSSKDLTALSPQDLDKQEELWQKQKKAKQVKLLEGLPDNLEKKIAGLDDPLWSPDGNQLLYREETADGLIYRVLNLKPQLANTLHPSEAASPPASPTPAPIQESPVFRLAKDRFAKLFWYPDSRHLLILEKKSAGEPGGTVSLIEVDGGNPTKIFSGRLLQNFLAPFPNGSKIVVLTTFNPQTQRANLYSINLR